MLRAGARKEGRREGGGKGVMGERRKGGWREGGWRGAEEQPETSWKNATLETQG